MSSSSVKNIPTYLYLLNPPARFLPATVSAQLHSTPTGHEEYNSYVSAQIKVCAKPH